ncbi:hypothetical protein BHM03_00030708 [Ensete ventricosum]|nr:hypothetical protein BHM03_00030708 [Ensete ventricosum]
MILLIRVFAIRAEVTSALLRSCLGLFSTEAHVYALHTKELSPSESRRGWEAREGLARPARERASVGSAWERTSGSSFSRSSSATPTPVGAMREIHAPVASGRPHLHKSHPLVENVCIFTLTAEEVAEGIIPESHLCF